MLRIKITKNTSKYKAGETVVVSNNEAFGLLDSGYAEQTKDMTSTDMKTKGKNKKNG